ncbi:MAG: HlyD family efflux transporter periplasmic adaptor subunit [Rhodospirillales bacterium]|nr:HlyD family efflux transporter periplasmic adaptor subunit [Rhodospirillales bacterium]
MKVRRERPSQRLHHRVSAPVKVDLPKGTFDVSDWSLGGFGIEQYPGEFTVGDEITCSLHIPFQGFNISFDLQVSVTRSVPGGFLGGSFLDVGDREREIMTHFIDDLVRGTMTTVQDTIVRIDSPVTPVATTPDINPTEQLPIHRWPWKVWAMSAFYLSAGLGVVAYAALVIYVNFLRLEVETAVVTAPIQAILATADGKIEKTAIPVGIKVAAETPLIVIADHKLQEAIDMAAIRIDRTTMELVAKQKELESEKGRLRDYRTIALSQLEQVNAKIRSLEQRGELARRQTERFQTLASGGWVTKSKMDEVMSAELSLKGDLEAARLLRLERRLLLKNIEKGRFYTGGKLEGRLNELQAAVDLHWDQVMLAKDEMTVYQRHRDSLVLSAPTQGRIVKLLRNAGSNVKRGDEVALFERDEVRVIEAFLTQEEVLEIGLGDAATVYFPSIDQRVDAVVIAIDRTTGYIDEIESRYQWRGPKDRSAKVSLRFLDLNDETIRKRFSPGLPAVVVFERRNTDELQRHIMDRLNTPADPGATATDGQRI